MCVKGAAASQVMDEHTILCVCVCVCVCGRYDCYCCDDLGSCNSITRIQLPVSFQNTTRISFRASTNTTLSAV